MRVSKDFVYNFGINMVLSDFVCEMLLQILLLYWMSMYKFVICHERINHTLREKLITMKDLGFVQESSFV